ncbi:MAG: hypothetical protein KDA58_15120, partial [Planctomycetaceae bacterium]|nr:hypothetical protein [Planctomycetaceae bacterium]
MSQEFKLPNVGEGVQEADIAEILVAVGDTVEPGQIVMELETEKAVMELPIEIGGVIEKVLVSQGQTVPIGQPLFLVSGDGAAAKAAAPATAAKADAPAPVESKPTPAPTTAPAPPAPAAASGGTIVFNLPNLGEGVNSADVAEVIVKVGDVLTAEQVVMELETEKAVMELPCPHAGTVTKVLVKEGDTIAIGAPVLELSGTSVGGGTSLPEPSPSSKSEPAKADASAAPQQKPVSGSAAKVG